MYLYGVGTHNSRGFDNNLRRAVWRVPVTQCFGQHRTTATALARVTGDAFDCCEHRSTTFRGTFDSVRPDISSSVLGYYSGEKLGPHLLPAVDSALHRPAPFSSPWLIANGQALAFLFLILDFLLAQCSLTRDALVHAFGGVGAVLRANDMIVLSDKIVHEQSRGEEGHRRCVITSIRFYLRSQIVSDQSGEEETSFEEKS